jgi:hypothetical protein
MAATVLYVGQPDFPLCNTIKERIQQIARGCDTRNLDSRIINSRDCSSLNLSLLVPAPFAEKIFVARSLLPGVVAS